MIVSCLLPFAIIVLFGLLAPPLSRRVRPTVGIWALSLGGFLLTLFLLVSASVVVAVGAGQLEPFAHLGHWSAGAVSRNSPYQEWSIWAATGLLAGSTVRGLAVLLRQGRRLQTAWSVSHSSPGGLVVIDDSRLLAYGIPGWPGRIVVSTALLRGLDAKGRRAVLAHEQTHLSERHDLHQFLAAVSAGINPLLRRTAAALSLACERRADEVAAREVGDRRVVARAIVAVACPEVETIALSASGADVPLRVEALLSQERNPIASALLLVALLLAEVLSATSVLWLAHDLRDVLIAARR